MSKNDKFIDVKYIGEKTEIINAVVGVIPEKGNTYNIPILEWEAASKDDWKEAKAPKKKATKKAVQSKGV